MKVYNLGSLNIDYVYQVDHFVAAGETLSSSGMQIFPGGKGLNQSVALARAGVPVIHGAVIGDSGSLLMNTLSDSGADISRIQAVAGSCGHAIIQVDPNGQNCILLFAGTNHCVDRGYIEAFLADAQPGDILALQNETSGLLDAFQIAGEKKMQIAFNPSPFHKSLLELPICQVTWWFCNEIEAAALFGSEDPEEIGVRFRETYPDSHLILTLGSRGSMFIDRENWLKQPVYPVKAVDTTAAGDTFTGFFLSAIVGGQSPAQALNLASRASSVSVSRPGASASIPSLAELTPCNMEQGMI